MVPPLVLDIDGTLTRTDDWGLDPRIFDPIHEWDAPVVLATGKSFPYPVGLAQFIGIRPRVVAENGGVVYANERVDITADHEAVQGFLAAYEADYQLGWGAADVVNRWRETDVVIHRDEPVEPIRALAEEYGLVVADSGYAYHVMDPDLSKGVGVRTLGERGEIDLEQAVAIGDSETDVPMFEAVGHGVAVANADAAAKAAADEVLERGHAEGTADLLERLSG
ncbi:MAG: phosphoglycolate phosphatase [Natrialbaceae archaeon]|nr:phosphoglycolate phosphatase [Natrialbaceae archaeon]